MRRSLPNRLVQGLFLLTAVTFPLHAVEFWRLRVWTFQIPWPVVTISAAVMIGLLTDPQARLQQCRQLFARHRGLVYALMAFWLWHVVFLYRSAHVPIAFKEVVKLTWDIFVLGGVFMVFPREEGYLRRFFTVMIWASSLLLCVLLYRYIIVFKAPFLGKEMAFPFRHGRNQLSWYLSLVAPFAIFYFWKSGVKRFTTWIPVFVLLFSIVYVESRSAWLSLLAGMVYVLWSAIHFDKRMGWRMAGTGLAGFLVFGLLLGTVVARVVDLSEVPLRALSIVWPGAVPESLSYLGKYSYAVRGSVFASGLQQFAQSPWVGVGLSNGLSAIKFEVHNVHIGLLLELGLFAELMFLYILHVFWRKSRFAFADMFAPLGWVSIASRASLVVLFASTIFYDCYTTFLFWQFVCLTLVVADHERLRRCLSPVGSACPVPEALPMCAHGLPR